MRVVREAVMLFFWVIQHKPKTHAFASLLTIGQRPHTCQHCREACVFVTQKRRARGTVVSPLCGHPFQIGHQQIGGRL